MKFRTDFWILVRQYKFYPFIKASYFNYERSQRRRRESDCLSCFCNHHKVLKDYKLSSLEKMMQQAVLSNLTMSLAIIIAWIKLIMPALHKRIRMVINQLIDFGSKVDDLRDSVASLLVVFSPKNLFQTSEAVILLSSVFRQADGQILLGQEQLAPVTPIESSRSAPAKHEPMIQSLHQLLSNQHIFQQSGGKNAVVSSWQQQREPLKMHEKEFVL